MKTPERILTEHALGEITFDSGLTGTLYTVFSREGFDNFVFYMRHLAYYEADPNNPSSLFADLNQHLRMFDLRDSFKKLRFGMEQLKWTRAQQKDWIEGFCKAENLSRYESADELRTALKWTYVRSVQSFVLKCAFPGPTDWLTQSKIAAAREIEESEELVK
jgi:hypothetical protein